MLKNNEGHFKIYRLRSLCLSYTRPVLYQGEISYLPYTDLIACLIRLWMARFSARKCFLLCLVVPFLKSCSPFDPVPVVHFSVDADVFHPVNFFLGFLRNLGFSVRFCLLKKKKEQKNRLIPSI